MVLLIQNNEISEIAFSRGISEGLFLPSQILAVQRMWFADWVSSEFYSDVIDNVNDYYSFIDDYVKPVIAFGAIYTNFESVTSSLTDKGLIRIQAEGVFQVVDDLTKTMSKTEYKQIAYSLIQDMRAFCEKEKKAGNSLFESYKSSDLQPVLARFDESRGALQRRAY